MVERLINKLKSLVQTWYLLPYGWCSHMQVGQRRI